MKNLKNMYLKTTTGLSALLISADLWAGKFIKKPDFVDDVTPDKLNQAGENIMLWVGAFIGITIAVSSSYAGYLILSGKSQEGWDLAKNIIIGAVISVVLAGVVFMVID
ncbi:MAG: hypothetical protein JKY54_19740 [Flavobacteriales bacterium]|nr:hypothetical protein [Flavobacteriales bacterium]